MQHEISKKTEPNKGGNQATYAQRKKSLEPLFVYRVKKEFEEQCCHVWIPFFTPVFWTD